MSVSNDALFATMLQEWRIKNAGSSKINTRNGIHGSLDFVLSQNTIANPLVSAEFQSSVHASTGRIVKVPVWVRPNVSTSDGRSCNIPNNEVKTKLIGVEFVSIRDGFHIYPNRYDNNEVALQEQFAQDMDAMVERIKVKLNGMCRTSLSTKKNTVWSGANLMGHTQTGNVVGAYKNQRMDFMGDLSSVMHSLGWNGHLNVIGEFGTENTFTKLYEHSTYNDVNRTFEYMDKTLYIDGGMTNASGNYATMYMVPDGMVCMLSRVSRAEANSSKGVLHSWGNETLPGLGNLLFGTHVKKVEGDVTAAMQGSGTFTQFTETSVGDMTCDMGYEYGWSTDIAIVYPDNDAPSTVPSPVLAAAISASDSE